jgi:hypothetical protein
LELEVRRRSEVLKNIMSIVAEAKEHRDSHKILVDRTIRMSKCQAQGNIDKVLGSRCGGLIQRLSSSSHLSIENLIEKEKKITIDVHTKVSCVSHNRGKEDFSVIGRKRMSDKEFDR